MIRHTGADRLDHGFVGFGVSKAFRHHLKALVTLHIHCRGNWSRFLGK